MARQAGMGSIDKIGWSVQPSAPRLVTETLRCVGSLVVACLFFCVAFVL
jgi:hypothetical protein